MTVALRLREIEEAHADDAFLAMSKLRDEFVRSGHTIAVRLVDQAIENLTLAVRVEF